MSINDRLAGKPGEDIAPWSQRWLGDLMTVERLQGVSGGGLKDASDALRAMIGG